jgi:hypothetical protein
MRIHCEEHAMTVFTFVRRPALARVQGYLVGGFVVVQLVFLFAANLLPLFPQRVSPQGELTDDITQAGRTFASDWLQTPLDVAGSAARQYGEATGQMQNWALFAPGIAPQATFPVVELTWENDRPSGENYETRRVLLRSEFEPEDRQHFVHMDLSQSRLFNYEFRMTHPLWFCTDESLERMPELWQEWVPHRVSRQQRSLHAYLMWKVNCYAAEHPEEPVPNTAVLLVRCYRMKPPGSAAEELPPEDRPLVRLTSLPPTSGCRRPTFGGPETLEVFNPVTKEFQPVAAETGHE